MIAPPQPTDEAQRLLALRSLELLDTPFEERFDRLTRLAKRLFDVDAAIVSLVDADRQWFKSVQGATVRQTPRRISFCGHAILDDPALVVEDAKLDERFHDNPLVVGEPHVRFYAGRPLRTPDGHRVGVFCLNHSEPRRLAVAELGLLHELACLAERELVALGGRTIDPLTGLSTYNGFCQLAEHALESCARADRPAIAVVLQLDSFSDIQTGFGAEEATAALKAFADLVRTVFWDPDVIARTGNRTISVLTTNATAITVQACLRRLEAQIGGYNARVADAYALRFSVGLASYASNEHRGVDDLLTAAERGVSVTDRLTSIY